MDLELPAEIYNFLQTHIPEKKYAIVVEIEKQSAVRKSTKTIEISEIHQTPQADKNEPMKGKSGVSKQEQQIRDFEIKVKKLKLMHDSGILTDKEFRKLKNELLNSL
jgi:DNA replication initiation complex subunit (GINS family)